jgi:glycosyltransferase involved in cell wall biosynthesis
MMRLKVAIVNLTGGGLSHGYINYLSATLPLLLRHPRLSDIFIFVPPGFAPLFHGILPPENVFECDDSLSGRRGLRREIARISPDVLFFPSNRWLNFGPIPSVAMVQSMLPMVMPFGGNGLLDIVKNLARARLTKIACQRANRVIAISDYVRKFLVDTWNIPPDRIGMIYHGVNPPLPPDAQKIPGKVPREWGGEFLFTAGSMHPYRGLDDVIKALALLASQGVRPPVVIAGGADSTQLPYLQKMQNLAEKSGVQAQIAWTGHLEVAEMSWCYSHCRLFLMTSRVEACPNIALEAMSHRAFCLAADNPPLPEIFQEAALYYRPKDGRALAQAINTALAYPPDAAAGRRLRAQQRAGDFTWEETTDRTVREFDQAIKKL